MPSSAQRRRSAMAAQATQAAVRLPYAVNAAPAESGVFSVANVTRLSHEVYLDLEKQIPLRGLPDTELQAAWQNGAEYVLRKLRDGYVNAR